MGSQTAIQWCDDTFNPWVGCSKVHTGCLNCYAEADFDKRKHFANWGPHGTRVKTTRENWRKPYHWNAAAEAIGIRARVFCASLADVFEDWKGPITNSKGEILYDVGDRHYRPASEVNPRAFPGFNAEDDDFKLTMDDMRGDLFWMIDNTPSLDWLLLTKRPENIANKWPLMQGFRTIFPGAPGRLGEPVACVVKNAFRENVWLGTSISDQRTADDAIPHLLTCRRMSPVLFLSVEPLVGSIYLHRLQSGGRFATPGIDGVDWVIVGGESGRNARPCNLEWIESIVTQCQNAGVPCFVKQLGSNPVGPGADQVWDKAGGDPSEWPEVLRVRQFPRVAV